MVRLISVCVVMLCTLPCIAFEGPLASSPNAIRYAWKNAASADGKTIAVCYGHWDERGMVALYDRETGQERKRIPLPRGARALVAAPGGRDFVVGDFLGNYYVIDFQSGEIKRTWRHDSGSVEALSFSYTGKFLAASSNSDKAMIWEYRSGDLVGKPVAHDANVYNISISPNEQVFASSDQDANVFVNDLMTGEVLHRIQHTEGTNRRGSVSALEWSLDGKRLFTGGTDGRICCWDTATGEQIVASEAVRSRIDAILLSRSGDLLYGMAYGVLCKWDSKTLEQSLYPGQKQNLDGSEPLHPDAQRGAVFSVRVASEDQLVSSSWDKTTKLWDLKTGECVRTMQPKNKGKIVRLVAIDDAEWEKDSALVAFSDQGYVSLVDSSRLTNDVEQQFVVADSPLTGITHVVSRDRTIVIRNAEGEFFTAELTGAQNPLVQNLQELKLPADFDSSVLAMELVKQEDSLRVLIAHQDATSSYSLQAGVLSLEQTISEFDRTTVPAGACFDPEGNRLLYRGEDGTSRIYQLDWSGPAKAKLVGSPRVRLSAREAPFVAFVDDQWLSFAYGESSYLVAWGKEVSDSPIKSMQMGGLSAVATMDSGKTLIAGSTDGALRRYEKPPETIPALASRNFPDKQFRFVGISADSKTIWAVTLRKELYTFDALTLESKGEVQVLSIPGVSVGAIMPDRSGLFLTDFGGRIYPFGLPNWQRGPTLQPMRGRTDIDGLRPSPSGTRCLVGYQEGALAMLDLQTMKPAWTTKLDDKPIVGCSWAPDEKNVVVSSGDYRRWQIAGTGFLLDSSTGKLIRRFDDSQNHVTAAEFSGDGQHVSFAGRRVLTYDVGDPEAQPVVTELPERGGYIIHLDGDRSVVSMRSGRIEICDLKRGKRLSKFAGHAAKEGRVTIGSMDVSPDGKLLASVDLVGGVYVWPLTE